MKTRLICPSFERYKTVSAMVGTARCAVPARVVAGGTNDRVAPAIRKSCAAARGADIAARCPYHAKHIPFRKEEGNLWRHRVQVTEHGSELGTFQFSSPRSERGE